MNIPQDWSILCLDAYCNEPLHPPHFTHYCNRTILQQFLHNCTCNPSLFTSHTHTHTHTHIHTQAHLHTDNLSFIHHHHQKLLFAWMETSAFQKLLSVFVPPDVTADHLRWQRREVLQSVWLWLPVRTLKLSVLA